MNKNYIILREGGDIDILSKKNRLKENINNFKKKNYISLEKRFYHIALKKIIPIKKEIDLQFGGLNYNHVIFFKERYFFKKKISKKIILNLALLLHLIVNKEKITEKRKKEFFEDFEDFSEKEKAEFFSICEKEYGEKITKKIKGIIKKEEINIKKLKWQIILKKSNFFQQIKFPIILILNQIYKYKEIKKKYIIAFLGVDGSGKTTSIKNLHSFLEKNNIKNEIGNLGVYHDRTKFMKLLSKFVKKEKNKRKAVHKLNINYTKKSTIKNIIRIIDIYLRYKKTLKKAKKNNSKIIIFDRYFYDIILQSKLDIISKILLKIIPKPNKLFFLTGDTKRIYERKKERNIIVLTEQIIKFKKEIVHLSNFKEIKTETKKQTIDEIKNELNNKYFLECI
jgi:thymidylate kinase